MEGCQILTLYFSHNNAQSLQILANKQKLKCMLEDTSLVLLLRYLQNLHLYDLETNLKVLFLLSRLLKINPSKICNLLPFQTFTMPEFKHSDIDQFERFIYQKILNYVNYLARQRLNDDFSLELEGLTKNLLKIYHLISYKNIKVIKYAKVFYWIVQQRLYQQWKKINKGFQNLQNFNQARLKDFYENYCNFCKYKRKIPKIMHRNLKSVEFSSQENEKIQSRYKEICSQDKINKEQFYFSTSNIKTMISLISHQFQDD